MPRALAWLIECEARGERCALATIVGIEGAAPRRIGAQMAVTADGRSAGSFSGGCLDAAVIEDAQRALADGASRRVRYGAQSPYVDLVLPCGSGLDLQFDGALPPATLAPIAAALKQRRAFVLEWREPTQPPVYRDLANDDEPSSILGDAGRDRAPVRIVQRPGLRLVLAGAGDTLLTMCALARAADIDVVALTPDAPLRAPLAALGVQAHVLQAKHALPALVWDAYTAAIALFHDHDWELPFLQAALASDACLVGAMGSPRAQAARLDALRERGVSAQALARLRGPLGLLPRARDPQELAVSILAEAMQAYRTHCFPRDA
jgi:xanthine dehydrogenase accessory factor